MPGASAKWGKFEKKWPTSGPGDQQAKGEPNSIEAPPIFLLGLEAVP
jgi:hypothetical protein